MFVAVLLLAAMAIAAPVCGSDGRSEASRTTPDEPTLLAATTVPTTTRSPIAIAPTDSSIPSPTPLLTSTPAPKLHDPGWAVYAREDDLYVGALDGSAEHRLTHGAASCDTDCEGGAAMYAGSAMIDGRLWLYYAKADGLVQPQLYALTTMDFTLSRRPFDGGSEEQLVHFAAFVHGFPIASVAPDGLHVLYTAIDGMHRYDLATHTDVKLTANVTSCSLRSGATGPCKIFEAPRWSPDEERAVVDVAAMEGANLVLFDPLAVPTPATYQRLPVGGRFARWSPDGSQLCLSEDGFAGGTGGVMAMSDLVFRQLVAPTAEDCAWSTNGGLAVSYAFGGARTGIRLFDAAANLTRDIAVGDPRLQPVGWLSDGAGLVVSPSFIGVDEPQPEVLMLDGSTRALPFAADRVLAVLP